MRGTGPGSNKENKTNISEVSGNSKGDIFFAYFVNKICWTELLLIDPALKILVTGQCVSDIDRREREGFLKVCLFVVCIAAQCSACTMRQTELQHRIV